MREIDYDLFANYAAIPIIETVACPHLCYYSSKIYRFYNYTITQIRGFQVNKMHLSHLSTNTSFSFYVRTYFRLTFNTLASVKVEISYLYDRSSLRALSVIMTGQ